MSKAVATCKQVFKCPKHSIAGRDRVIWWNQHVTCVSNLRSISSLAAVITPCYAIACTHGRLHTNSHIVHRAYDICNICIALGECRFNIRHADRAFINQHSIALRHRFVTATLQLIMRLIGAPIILRTPMYKFLNTIEPLQIWFKRRQSAISVYCKLADL